MKRIDFIKTLTLASLSYNHMKLNELKNITDNFKRSRKMPVLFIGHGHPMNAILNNDFTRALATIGTSVEKPDAILIISAHWETTGTFVSVNPAPRTIYDFGRFDDRLFEINYRAKGHPEMAREVINLATSVSIKEDAAMGLDHGAWTVLKHMFPTADIPVFEMSIDYTKAPAFHYSLGKELKALRDKGVLILCSGNIVHNLYLTDWNNIDAKPHDWNIEFDHIVKQHINERSFEQLIDYTKLGTAAKLSIPTNDHYLPMLYSLGFAEKDEPVQHLYEGYQYAGISMRCFQIG